MKPSDFTDQEEVNALLEIERMCGITFQRVQSIRVHTQEEAETILPVLLELLHKSSATMRSAIYTCLDCKYVRRHLDSLLRFWEKETYGFGSHVLGRVLSRRIDARHAMRAWEISRKKQDPNLDLLLAKLSRIRVTEALAKDAIVAELESGQAPYYRLVTYARVNDSRIREWFSNQAGHPDRKVRRLAARVAGRPPSLPGGLVLANTAPSRGRPGEVYSTEIDADQAGLLLAELSSRYSLQLSDEILCGGFLGDLKQNRWYTLDRASRVEPHRIWLRMEDFDVVEIVITKCS